MPTKKIKSNRIAIGPDIGNSESEVAIEDLSGNQSCLVVPTVYTIGDYTSLREQRKGVGAAAAAQAEATDLAIEIEGRKLFIGRMAAERVKQPPLNIGDKRRYSSIEALAITLALTAAQLDSSITAFEGRVVSSLPVKWYEDKELKKQIKDRYTGRHEFKFNGREYIADLTYQRTVMEGNGALIVYGDAENHHVIMDAGGFTTDFLDMQGVKLLRSDSIEAGSEIMGKRFSDVFLEKFGIELDYLQLHEIVRAYGAHKNKKPAQFPQIHFGRDEILPTQYIPYLHTEARTIADAVLSKASSMFGTSKGKVAATYKNVFLVGGCMHSIGDLLLTEMATNASRPPDCESANARGNCRAAAIALEASLK